MSMTFASLKTAVAGYLHDTTLTTQIPDFIDQARTRIGMDLRGLSNYTTGTITSFSNGLSALPTNMGKLVAVVGTDNIPLRYFPIEQVSLYQSGVYSVAGGDLFVPDAGTTTVLALSYFAIPDALVNAGDVSVPMLEQPQLWLYASVYEAAMYKQDYELADRMRNLYEQEIRNANRAGDEVRFGAAPSVVSDQLMIQSQSTL